MVEALTPRRHDNTAAQPRSTAGAIEVELIRCFDYNSSHDHLVAFGRIQRKAFIDAVERFTGKPISKRARADFPCFQHSWLWDESELAWGDCDDDVPGSVPVTTVKRMDWDWDAPAASLPAEVTK